jgi:hypothetical protein
LLLKLVSLLLHGLVGTDGSTHKARIWRVQCLWLTGLATGIVAQMWTMEATSEGPSCRIQDWWVMGVGTVMMLWLCTDEAVAIADAADAWWWFGSKLRRTRPASGVCNGRGKGYCHRHCRSK